MRPIHLVRLDKSRPAVILTRPHALEFLRWITVAPITTTIRGISTEVAVGIRNGLDADCVISCDNIQLVSVDDVGRQLGWLYTAQEPDLTRAIAAAFDLVLPESD